ncbi:pteridine reductase [Arenimonas caeni]|jgi:pteridine reductase|uniref:Pteridine reductase n=1 Tax=Arenimonas caeni TaxID=2058085 RepID=A0A2P6M8N7_9GAMM|nr:pteridine reductase [Arenimonas caeni]MDY0021407.1 pteridine reductase [Arenimonas caeni]PRH82354.1 pteridine reductase [Arenimonas caeni]
MPNPRPVALVTGAAKRVGAQIARRLHAAGYDLALHHRRSGAEMAALVAGLEGQRPGSVLVLQAELADDDAPVRLVQATLDRFGRLDALVNNASSFRPTPLGAATPADWDELFAANARAPFFLAQAAAPTLRAAGGAIVNLGDIYGERPLARHTLYCMAKAALLMMTQSLAKELGPEVRVNAVAPGAVMWPEEGKAEHEKAAMLAATALRRAGDPDDVAEAVRWLLQDARYTTGQVIRVDGGRSLNL